MWNLTKLETLEKAVVDTKAAFDVAYAAESVAWYAWDEARLDLNNYLKEQDK
tara:strand:- start:195 stop:350 length:156 start_codon:yes stop_codon:yes gene_type:complete